MKNVIKFVLTLVVILFTTCVDRDIIDDKGLNFFLPEVENLKYTRSGNVVTLTWQIPSNISSDYQRPVRVCVYRLENNINRGRTIVQNEDTSLDVTINPAIKYRFYVRLQAFFTADARPEGRTETVYSKGTFIEIQ